MCLAIPGKLVELSNENGLKMGIVDVNGSKTRACLEYVPDIQVGQYTIVHAGFAQALRFPFLRFQCNGRLRVYCRPTTN